MAGTEVLNGTQLPLDAAYILNLLAGNKLTERGQDIGWNDRLLTYYERERDAQQQWQRDAASLGLEAANLNFQQRQADAQNELQRQGGALQRDDLNFRQRNALATGKMSILDMLNSRRGPGNWVKYGSLLNGLAGPAAERSTTLDPFDILKDLVKESDAFSKPIASVNQPASVNMGSGAPASNVPSWLLQPTKPLGSSMGAGGGGGGGAAGGAAPASAGIFGSQAWGTPGYATNNPPTSVSGLGAEDVFSGLRNETVAYLKPGMSGLHVTGTAGPSYGRDYTGFSVANPATGKLYGADEEIPGGSNIWITRLNEGGMVKGGAPMALTGDGKGKRPSKNSELAMATVGADGMPVLKVFDPDETRAMLERMGVRVPRAATGGTYGSENTDPTITHETYAPGDLGNQPFIKKLFGGRGGSKFRGFGATLSNPSIGVNDAPWAINLQALSSLDPSERDATQELFDTGLAVDFRDVLEQARRAAPFGRTFGPAGYGF